MSINAAALTLVNPALSESLRPRLKLRAQVWRDPDVTPETPTANTDAFGFPVLTSAPNAPTPTGRRLLREYDALLSQAGAGNEMVVAGSVEVLAPWIVQLLEADAPDVLASDEIHIGDRVFAVVNPGGAGTFSQFRLVRCQERV